MLHPTTQYRFVKPDAPYAQIADVVRSAISTVVVPFYEGDGFKPDLVSVTNCIEAGRPNPDGITYRPGTIIENIFHIDYNARAVGQLVIDEQIAVNFYGEAPLSKFEFRNSGDEFKTTPKDREAIEQAIIRELIVRGLVQINDADSKPLPP